MYIRSMAEVVVRLAQKFPVVGITGPRQSGKTTLAKTLFPHLPYVSLENIDVRTVALRDPRAFLKKYERGAIFDEVQNTPDLLSYLQGVVDADLTKGRFVLTGSQNFALNESITQSLAGRIGMVTLLPLSMAELGAFKEARPYVFNGGYPGRYQSNIDPLDFYPSYIQTYLERDVRQIKNIGNLNLFQTFVRLCAGRIGQVVNFSSLAQDCAISHTTAREWLSILEASYIVFLLKPFYNNYNKRLIKMPKLYFYDTGLACSLFGLEKQEQLENHFHRGALFENLIVLEVLKKRLNQGRPPNLYFWRDYTGHEVDLIGEWGGQIHAIEIKSGTTLQPDFTKKVRYFASFDPSIKSYLVYGGDFDGVDVDGVTVVSFAGIDKIF